MIFSELYSAYYNTVAKIISAALSGEITEKDICGLITENAFSESVLMILPALKNGKWQLLDRKLSSTIRRKPTMPLTLLEKQWLKAIMSDPRIKLFGAELDGIDNVEPLFTAEDYKIFDKYADGDPFDDESYIARFRLLAQAIKTKRSVMISMNNRHGKCIRVRFYPKRLEYSEKDDKFRVIASGCRYPLFNLGKLLSCDYCEGTGRHRKKTCRSEMREVTLKITDEKNAVERVMLHFAHFEKRAERLDDMHCTVTIRYNEYDETEIVIRVLSFGPYVVVTEPSSFKELIKERLNKQKSCGLK